MSTTRRRARRRRCDRIVVTSVAIVCATFVSASRVRAEPTDTRAHVAVTVAVAEPEYDGLQSLLDYEARLALAEGKYRRARRLFLRLLKIDPYDLRALREIGRVAHALGELDEAVKVLGKVDALDGTGPDPELHYIRGECLHALGRKGEAEVEFRHTVADLGAGPHDRRGTLWLARIAVLRGDLDGALRIYQPLLDQDDPNSATYAEVMLLSIEACVLAKDWNQAEVRLREFLAVQPEHPRGRALMAWILEGQGKLEEELALREEVAKDRVDRRQKTLDYARALERASDYSAALGHYRAAGALGVSEAADGIARLERRLSPEVAAGVGMRSDTSGSISSWRGAATIPLGFRFRLAASAVNETAQPAFGLEGKSATTASAWTILTAHDGGYLGLGATSRLEDGDIGASAIAQTSTRRDVLLQLRADGNVPWHETATTLISDGVYDAGAGTLYMKSEVHDRRILASFGVLARRLGLEPLEGIPMTRAVQLFGSAGVDVLVSSSTERQLRGDAFDNDMLTPRGLTTSTVVSYRHYEMTSDDPFGMRLVLVERSSIDELSGVYRRVLDTSGRFGGELRGGVGFDWVRWVKQWRAGTSVLFAASGATRLTLDYDVASESGTGITGRQHIGSMVLHVDI